MDDYKEMYYTLFNKMTDIINEIKEVQQKTEEMFISQNHNPDLKLVIRKDSYEK